MCVCVFVLNEKVGMPCSTLLLTAHAESGPALPGACLAWLLVACLLLSISRCDLLRPSSIYMQTHTHTHRHARTHRNLHQAVPFYSEAFCMHSLWTMCVCMQAPACMCWCVCVFVGFLSLSLSFESSPTHFTRVSLVEWPRRTAGSVHHSKRHFVRPNFKILLYFALRKRSSPTLY